MSNETLLPESKKSLLKWSDGPNTCEHQLPKIKSMTKYNNDTLALIPGDSPKAKYEWVQNQLSDKWIEIESEKDLPIISGYFWTMNPRGGMEQNHTEDINPNYHTHYMPITKPNPPKP